MSTKIITFSFYILFFLTPLFWMPSNYELFEYNKMMLVYLLTIIISTAWLLEMIKQKKLLLKRTPLDIPLLLFLAANIISTVLSIDQHTSIWGYYSRSNGGLLSTISYITLYYALVSNFDSSFIKKFLIAIIYGGLVTTLWAIPEHFGVSPSCVFLTGQFDTSCWIQNVQARVFATLGQPNWLAAYLAMILFPTIYLALTSTKKFQSILYSVYAILFYLAFTFTYSRGASLGLLAGIIVFVAVQLPTLKIKAKEGLSKIWRRQIIILASFVILGIIFGTALTQFKLVSKFATSRPSIAIPVTPTSTQLEGEGSETSQIRLVVWKGALEIFKHHPIFGSGVETFAYTYYNFRPAEHNLLSEWDFLYNKAHNEFVNYLATTGLVGFTTYMAVIITFIFWCIKYYVLSIKKEEDTHLLLIPALLASYISYLVQNFFGFSVVIVALFFYLFPGFAFLATNKIRPLETSKLRILNKLVLATIYRRALYTKITKITVLIVSFILLMNFISYYRADIIFSEGLRSSEAGNPGKAYNSLTEAVNLNPGEPFYRSELGFAAASAAFALVDQDATLSSQLKDQAIAETNEALRISPRNVSYLRTKIRTYYMLAGIDKSFTQKTLETLDQAIALAPTDAKLLYNKALILNQTDNNKDSITILDKTIVLKPNYKEAYYLLGTIFQSEGQKEKAVEQFKLALKYAPSDPQTLEKLKELDK